MLEIKNIEKSYRKQKALNNLNISLDNGVYGLLGPNGAGKSTLMNIITDNLRPDAGTVLWNEESTIQMGRKFRQILGYMPQQQGIYDDFTGRRFLSYIATLKGIKKDKMAEEIEAAAAYVNLSDELEKKLGAYSGGMKQRILIAQSILGDPQLLIMDEPTAGLDPKERVRVRELLQSLAENRIIIVATHVVSDIESISKEIIILKEGELIAKGEPKELIQQYVPEGSLEDVYMAIFGGEV